MSFLLKSFLYVGVVAVGEYFAVNNIPSLKANILEVVNPQVKESRLVRELATNIDELNTTLSDTAAGMPASATVVARTKELVQDSKDIIANIDALNDAHPGVASAVVAKIADLVIGNGGTSSHAPTATSTTIPGLSVAPGVSPLSPCLPQ